MSSESEPVVPLADELYKEKVRAEREKLEKAHRGEPALPPANLTFLVTTLATQAMVALGQIPDPFSEKAEFRPVQATHFIDTLQMLDEKTAGNRTPEESTVLHGCLHQLRMLFVQRQAMT